MSPLQSPGPGSDSEPEDACLARGPLAAPDGSKASPKDGDVPPAPRIHSRIMLRARVGSANISSNESAGKPYCARRICMAACPSAKDA